MAITITATTPGTNDKTTQHEAMSFAEDVDVGSVCVGEPQMLVVWIDKLVGWLVAWLAGCIDGWNRKWLNALVLMWFHKCYHFLFRSLPLWSMSRRMV